VRRLAPPDTPTLQGRVEAAGPAIGQFSQARDGQMKSLDGPLLVANFVNAFCPRKSEAVRSLSVRGVAMPDSGESQARRQAVFFPA
jgi:hypothetical protein